MTNFVTGVIGIALVAAFLGFMVGWVKALPLTIIAAGVMVLLLVDFVQSLRAGNSGAAR